MAKFLGIYNGSADEASKTQLTEQQQVDYCRRGRPGPRLMRARSSIQAHR
jgi:hypothetical protein